MAQIIYDQDRQSGNYDVNQGNIAPQSHIYYEDYYNKYYNNYYSDYYSKLFEQWKKNENSRLNAEYNRLNNENARLNAEYNRLNSENARLNAEYNRLNSENARLNAEYNRLKNENAGLNAEYNRLKNENVGLNAEYNRLNSENARLNAEYNRLKNENVGLNAVTNDFAVKNIVSENQEKFLSKRTSVLEEKKITAISEVKSDKCTFNKDAFISAYNQKYIDPQPNAFQKKKVKMSFFESYSLKGLSCSNCDGVAYNREKPEFMSVDTESEFWGLNIGANKYAVVPALWRDWTSTDIKLRDLDYMFGLENDSPTGAVKIKILIPAEFSLEGNKWILIKPGKAKFMR